MRNTRLPCLLLIVWVGLSQSLVPNSNLKGVGGDGGWSPRGNNAPVLYIPVREECYDDDDDDVNGDMGFFLPPLLAVEMRGGARGRSKREPPNPAESTLKRIKSFWLDKWKTASTAVGKPFQKLSSTIQKMSPFKSKKQDNEVDALQKELMETPIEAVVVPNSTILPKDVIDIAARRSGLLGRPLQTSAVEDFARSIKRYYARKGMMLHSVTGVTLQGETKTAEVIVEEPKVHEQPIQMVFLKEMVVDAESGNLMTFKQYRDYRKRRNTRGVNTLSKSDLNTTYVTSPDGRTSAEKVAKAMELEHGNHFQWNSNRWNNIAQSGIFRNVLGLNPTRMQDGSAQIQILVEEAPPRNLEYGVGKSLYTNSWEGEVDFEHTNLLGGGEKLGLSVKRGARDVEPSVRVRFADNKFGLERGYAFEMFSDFIGSQTENGTATDDQQENDDDLLDRKGVMVKLRNPIDRNIVKHSTLSASVERTSTTNGQHQRIGSTTLAVGPFRQDLPLEARSNVAGTVTLGSKLGDEHSTAFQPYAVVTGTTRQVIPLAASTAGSDRPITIAFQHSATTSSHDLPRHERSALWNSARIRGYKDKGSLATSVVGTTEVRVPVTIPPVIPAFANIRQDASVVVFADWSMAQEELNSPFFRKSSVGVGLRKSLQGIPLKFDFCRNQNGEFRPTYGFGTDFDV